MPRPTLVVMVKEPRPGRVKTRLGAGIGMTAAAWWFRHQATALIRRLRDPRWRVVLAVSPDRDGLRSRVWPVDLPRMPQGSGNLGRRMIRALRRAPHGPVCLVGADIPDLDARHIARAFTALRGHDVVFGPATDGGYWLIGTRHGTMLPPGLFDSVRWSGPNALADSVAAAGHLRVALADTLADVDRAADLHRGHSRISR